MDDYNHLKKAQETLQDLCFQLNESSLEKNINFIKNQYKEKGKGALIWFFDDFERKIGTGNIESKYLSIEELKKLKVLSIQWMEAIENDYDPEKEGVICVIYNIFRLPSGETGGQLYHIDKFSLDIEKNEELDKMKNKFIDEIQNEDKKEEKWNIHVKKYSNDHFITFEEAEKNEDCIEQFMNYNEDNDLETI